MTADALLTTRPNAGPSSELTSHDERGRIESLLDEITRTRRELSALHAREAQLLSAALDVAREQGSRESRSAARDIPVRSMAAQIAAAVRASDRTIQQRLDSSAVLVHRFAATFAALASGTIDRAHAQVIVDAGLAIDDDDARAVYESAAVEIAARETPGRLRPAVRLLAQRLHPVPLAERHQSAATRRDVSVRDLDDGMAELIATLPAPLAHGIHDRLTRLARAGIDARQVDAAGSSHEAGSRNDADSRPDAGSPGTAASQGADACAREEDLFGGSAAGAGGAGGAGHAPADSGDLRSLGEVRADAFADLLLTGHATPEAINLSTAEADAIVAHVTITVPALTLLGGDDAAAEPAQLVGRGPIDPRTARRLAGGATGWDRVLTHPVTGVVLAVDRYRPSEQLRRSLRVRDEHCRFPGCRQPTHRCDIDHTIAREHDGPTKIRNLAHLCRRHHVLKHNSAWRVSQREDGVLEWTSPTGRVYPDLPARTLAFTPHPEADTGTCDAPF